MAVEILITNLMRRTLAKLGFDIDHAAVQEAMELALREMVDLPRGETRVRDAR